MRSLVLVLAALLIAAATWLLIDGDSPLPALAPPHENAPPAPPPADDAALAHDAEQAPSDPPPPDSAPAQRTPPPAAPRPDEPGAVFLVVNEAGNPVAQATVLAIVGERDLASARTDTQGLATLRGVPSDAGHRVRAWGYWPVTGAGCPIGVPTRIVLREAPRLTGTVFGPGGEAVAGARVVLLPPVVGRLGAPARNLQSAMHAVTDDGGHFGGAWPDANAYDLVVEARGYAPGIVPALRFATQGSAPVIVQLLAGAVLTGVVRRADGVPLPDVQVEVSAVRDDPLPGHRALGPLSRWRKGQPLGSTMSMARGEFTLANLPAMPVVVTLWSEHVDAIAYATLAAGRTTEVELRAAENASVIGEVARAGETPVHVFLYGGGLRPTDTVDGAFVFLDVPPGRYLVGAEHLPGANLHAAVQAYIVNGSTPLATVVDLAPGEQRNVVLPAPVPATGSVSGSASIAGAPAAGHLVALEPLDGPGASRRESAVAADGSYLVEGIPPGDYDARLRKPGDPKVLAEARCRVRGGDKLRVTLAAP